MNTNHIVKIISHTEKSFAVYTNNVLHYMDSIANLGGIFEPRIENRETGEHFMGWIFYIDKKEEIQKWINAGCPQIRKNHNGRPKDERVDSIKSSQGSQVKSQLEFNRESKRNISFEKILFPPKKKVTLSPVDLRNEQDRLRSIEKSIEMLTSKFNAIEIENNLLTSRINSLELEISTLKNVPQNNKVEDEYEIFDQTDIDQG